MKVPLTGDEKWVIWKFRVHHGWMSGLGLHGVPFAMIKSFPTWREAWDYAIAKATEVGQ